MAEKQRKYPVPDEITRIREFANTISSLVQPWEKEKKIVDRKIKQKENLYDRTVEKDKAQIQRMEQKVEDQRKVNTEKEKRLMEEFAAEGNEYYKRRFDFDREITAKVDTFVGSLQEPDKALNYAEKHKTIGINAGLLYKIERKDEDPVYEPTKRILEVIKAKDPKAKRTQPVIWPVLW